METPDTVLKRLEKLHPEVIDLSLDRIERLLVTLDHPEKKLPPVIHVAGTNGKGSTIAFLRAFYEAAGYRVHVYTSPHLVHFAERIRLAGALINDTELVALLKECERRNNEEPITFFEATTAAAFLAFSRVPADILLLETGMGGRLDATNVIEHPLLTVMTPLSLDHQQYLGNSLEMIAGEKAAIMKKDTPCITAVQPAPARGVIQARASVLAIDLWCDGENWTCRIEDGCLHYHGPEEHWVLPPPVLPGIHQIANAGLALACVERLQKRFPVTSADLERGMSSVTWPARLQQLRNGPLVDSVPSGWELWLDGGHNPAAGEILAQQASQWNDRPLYLVFGMLRTKDATGFLAPLAPYVDGLRAVPIPGEPLALTAEEAVGHARMHAITDSMIASDVAMAVRSLSAASSRPGRILICGSLYLAGTVLRDFA